MAIKVRIPETELFDPKTEEFFPVDGMTLTMEHSLISISKWESKWCVPFIEGPNPKSREKTDEMWYDYFRCMVISNKDVDANSFRALPRSEINRIFDYINKECTASSVPEVKGRGGPPEQVTSELIYFWMINYGVPDRFEKWHLSRLLMLIRICQRKTSKPEKKSKADRSLEYARISAQRRKAAAARKK